MAQEPTTTDRLETLADAVDRVHGMDWSNGMATETIHVEREACYVHVTRKCGSLNHPEIILFTVVPKNGAEPDYTELARAIPAACGLYGDLVVTFEGDRIKTTVVGV